MPLAVNQKRRRRIKALLWGRHGGRCHWCSRKVRRFDGTTGVLPPDYPTVDHIRATAEGGTDDIWNLVLACHKCNQRRMRQMHAQRRAKAIGLSPSDQPHGRTGP